MNRFVVTLPLAVALLSMCASGQKPFAVAFPGLQFNNPTDIKTPPDRSGLFIVTEQVGLVRVFDPREYESTGRITFLDIQDRVISGGELGLSGIVFDPDYASNGYFYVSYTTPDPLRSRISRFRVDLDNPFHADSASELVILELPQPYDTHNGAGMAFGPDGYLYAGFGDGGCCGDPENRSQNLDSLYGKILRIDVRNADVAHRYAIPPDNPFVDGTGRPEIYALGFRNPWRFSFDAATGDLWCGDVGQDKWEEIDIVRPGGNYGWRWMEGPECYSPGQCDSMGFVPPILAYEHDTSWPFAAIVAGMFNFYSEVVPGTYYPLKSGEFIYGDFVSGKIWAMERPREGVVHTRVLSESGPNITAFGTDRNGEIYFVAFDGYVYRFARLASAPTAGLVTGAHAFPNPGRDLTTLSYDMSHPGHPRVEVFDILGRRVRMIDVGFREPGKHEITIPLRDFSPGDYRWRVVLGHESISGPLIVR